MHFFSEIIRDRERRARGVQEAYKRDQRHVGIWRAVSRILSVACMTLTCLSLLTRLRNSCLFSRSFSLCACGCMHVSCMFYACLACSLSVLACLSTSCMVFACLLACFLSVLACLSTSCTVFACLLVCSLSVACVAHSFLLNLFPSTAVCLTPYASRCCNLDHEISLLPHVYDTNLCLLPGLDQRKRADFRSSTTCSAACR